MADAALSRHYGNYFKHWQPDQGMLLTSLSFEYSNRSKPSSTASHMKRYTSVLDVSSVAGVAGSPGISLLSTSRSR